MESDENEANSQADMNVNVKVEPKVKKSQKNKEKAKSIKNDLTQLHGKDENGLNKLKVIIHFTDVYALYPTISSNFNV